MEEKWEIVAREWKHLEPSFVPSAQMSLNLVTEDIRDREAAVGASSGRKDPRSSCRKWKVRSAHMEELQLRSRTNEALTFDPTNTSKPNAWNPTSALYLMFVPPWINRMFFSNFPPRRSVCFCQDVESTLPQSLKLLLFLIYFSFNVFTENG